MNASGIPISRRSAILTGAGAAIAAVSMGGRAQAGTRAAPAALTPQQQAGQRVIFSYSGLTVPQSLLTQISAGQAAGVIFFGDNISNYVQISSVIQQLRAATPAGPPLLLMTDQEGGEVRRLPGEPVLSEKQIGEASNPGSAATQAGNDAGLLLGSVGMNVNLSPVLDVFRQAGDFDDQYQRSYSSDPAVCAQLGGAFVTAQQKTRVAATAKHFPGLGAATASQNTDVEPVTLNVSLSDLRSIDELPYTTAIAAGVKLVMVSWALYPALDAALPAGLSPTIVQNELRTRLGFKGVTVTDALSAGALTNFGTNAQRAVSAAKAGMDLILISAQDVSQGQQAVTGLSNALTGGQLNAATFTAALNRVTALRNGLN
jgi:beta-N-acetylhexosaminidase